MYVILPNLGKEFSFIGTRLQRVVQKTFNQKKIRRCEKPIKPSKRGLVHPNIDIEWL